MITTTDFEVFKAGQIDYLTIFVRDQKTQDLVDVAGNSTFNLTRISDDTVVLTSTFPPTGNAVVQHLSTGVYQVAIDTNTYDEEYIAFFRCLLSSEVVGYNVYCKSVSAKYYKYAAILRNQVDKARKSISDDIENMDSPTAQPAICLFNGYKDSHMILHLDRGVHILNIIPPYTGLSVDTFPFDNFGSILIDAATISALESANIFSIDTDFNYSLGGNSLVIDHHTKLSASLASLLTRFDKSALSWKQSYRNSGVVLWQWSPGGARTARVINSMPSGLYSRLLSSIY